MIFKKMPDQIVGVGRRSMTSPNSYPNSLRWGCRVFEHLERERERERERSWANFLLLWETLLGCQN